ncbi:CBS domain-containing protein [Streptomyces sp. NBC_01210]|uniref:CBS domain-containing protein n=1 Tax=Streptomyces sp. NBC_01210 TaxID=2903774 RepID=UPI002E109E78|nr:CBS domain-containing protein [Streptomyces sp. NBC_01210]
MKRLRTVGDVTTHAVIAVGRYAPFREIVEIMRQWRISALPVLAAEGRVVGVVSEADLLLKAQGEDTSRAVTAGQLMTVPAITLTPHATIADAARLMARGCLKLLPVVDDEGRLKGVVSRGDLLKIYLRPDSDIAEEVRGELVARLIPAGSSALDVRVQDGAVTLTGTVRDSPLIDLLVRLARAVPGVVDVDAQLDVGLPVR